MPVTQQGRADARHDLPHLTTEDDPNNEPREVFAEAALMLCSAKPKTLTGRIAYSRTCWPSSASPIPPAASR